MIFHLSEIYFVQIKLEHNFSELINCAIICDKLCWFHTNFISSLIFISIFLPLGAHLQYLWVAILKGFAGCTPFFGLGSPSSMFFSSFLFQRMTTERVFVFYKKGKQNIFYLNNILYIHLFSIFSTHNITLSQ